MSKRTGNVYWANSRKIDKTDERRRRQYAVIRDDGKYVKVSKIRGFNENIKNEKRLMELDRNKYPLNKRSGIDRQVYYQRVDNRRLLELEDDEVFDKEPSFKLRSHDTHKAIRHTRTMNKQKKGKN